VIKKVAAAAPTPSSTTTTTKAPATALRIAQAEVGKTGPYAEGGFWWAKFVSWTAEQAKVPDFISRDGPSALYTDGIADGRLTQEPVIGGMVFIDLFGPEGQRIRPGDPCGHPRISQCRRADHHPGERQSRSVSRHSDDISPERRVRDRLRTVRDGRLMAFRWCGWKHIEGAHWCGDVTEEALVGQSSHFGAAPKTVTAQSSGPKSPTR